VQINDVLHQAFEMFSQQLKVHGIDVVWNLQADLPMVMGDPGRLEQVMINLLLNARDAIEERWQGAPPDTAVRQILLSTSRLGDDVVLWVCDTGTGVAPGMGDKIFEPFFTTKKVGQGTGLGLSISYGIIKECNGQIYVRPNAGGGACFVIKFPKPLDSP
jgi:histidine kinase